MTREAGSGEPGASHRPESPEDRPAVATAQETARFPRRAAPRAAAAAPGPAGQACPPLAHRPGSDAGPGGRPGRPSRGAARGEHLKRGKGRFSRPQPGSHVPSCMTARAPRSASGGPHRDGHSPARPRRPSLPAGPRLSCGGHGTRCPGRRWASPSGDRAPLGEDRAPSAITAAVTSASCSRVRPGPRHPLAGPSLSPKATLGPAGLGDDVYWMLSK